MTMESYDNKRDMAIAPINEYYEMYEKDFDWNSIVFKAESWNGQKPIDVAIKFLTLVNCITVAKNTTSGIAKSFVDSVESYAALGNEKFFDDVFTARPADFTPILDNMSATEGVIRSGYFHYGSNDTGLVKGDGSRDISKYIIKKLSHDGKAALSKQISDFKQESICKSHEEKILREMQSSGAIKGSPKVEEISDTPSITGGQEQEGTLTIPTSKGMDFLNEMMGMLDINTNEATDGNELVGVSPMLPLGESSQQDGNIS